MSVVVDSNLLIRAAINPGDATIIGHQLVAWHRAGETRHAPSLLRYEVANALARYVATGELSSGAADGSG